MLASANNCGRLDAADADSAAMRGRFAVRRQSRGDQEALAHGLLLESIEGLKLASELVADQQARASLRRHVDELTALLDAWAADASATRVGS